MVLIILMLVLLSLALSLPLCGLSLKLGHRLGQLDQPDDPALGGRKWHQHPTPSTGGIGIVWAVVLPIGAGLLWAWGVPSVNLPEGLQPVVKHLPGLRAQTPGILAVLGGLFVLHVLGVIDDRLRLGPMVKLLVQMLVAGVLAAGFDVRILTLLDHALGPAGWLLSVMLTVLWIVVVTNAMNFLDNMDGLSAGVGAIIAGIYLAANLIGGQWFVAALAALLLGALLGFLFYNFPPARLFMGDGGSLVLGYLLAILAIRTTYVGTPSPEAVAGAADGAWSAALMPLVVMAVPLYDFTSVTLIRLSRGQSPFQGDRNHFSHRLVRKGLSQRGAVIVIWSCTLATGLGGVMLRTLTPTQALLVAGQTLAILLTLALLERSADPRA